MRQFTFTDWGLLSLDTGTSQNNIGMVGLYDPSTTGSGEVTYEDVLEFIRGRLDVAESFRERVVTVPFDLDRPWWIRDGRFDLEYHVRHLSLPKPGTWRQFCTQVARIHSRPLDMTRPPWELYLIDGLDSLDNVPSGSFGTFLRIHHAALDGVAGAEILSALHSHHPDEAPVVGAGTWQPDPVPSDVRLLGRAALNGLARPVGVARQLRPVVGQLASLVGEVRNPVTTSPVSIPHGTRFNAPASAHRSFGSSFVELDELKKIRKGVPEAKINDIGLAVVGGAMRAYLADKDELPPGSLAAMMPISLRPTATRKHGAEGGNTGGNEFSVAPISMSTDVDDPKERLERIAQATAYVKQADAHPVRTLMAMSEEALGGLFGTVQRFATRTLQRTGRTFGVHTLVSNVPGPLTPVYFCGARGLNMTGLGPVMDGMLLNNGVGSYDGLVTFCFTVDRDAMPDPEFYEQCIYDAIAELTEATTP